MTVPPPEPQYPLKSPSVSPWAYIPYLEPQNPVDQETTDQFRARALDACLDTYLEYACRRLRNRKPLNRQEILHLIHHIKASGHFRSPTQIIWGTRSTEEQCEHLAPSELS
jgi:hypothetical protein